MFHAVQFRLQGLPEVELHINGSKRFVQDQHCLVCTNHTPLCLYSEVETGTRAQIGGCRADACIRLGLPLLPAILSRA